MDGNEVYNKIKRSVGTDMNAKSEEIRLRYAYRNLVLSGKVRLSFESARGLIGPDCAYHLYGMITSARKASRKSAR